MQNVRYAGHLKVVAASGYCFSGQAKRTIATWIPFPLHTHLCLLSHYKMFSFFCGCCAILCKPATVFRPVFIPLCSVSHPLMFVPILSVCVCVLCALVIAGQKYPANEHYFRISKNSFVHSSISASISKSVCPSSCELFVLLV